MINVNLLPPEIKEEILQSKKNAQILTALWKLCAIAFIYAVLFAGFFYYFYADSKTVASDLANKEREVAKYGTIEEEAKKASERLGLIKQIENGSYTWSGVIDEIMAVVPSGISLKSIKIDSSTKNRGLISGEAISKTLVASLRESLENSKKFEYVDIESSMTVQNPVSGKDVETFTLSFSLEKGALKK